MVIMNRDGHLWAWLGIVRRRPVVVSSPLPPDEFLGRLAEETSSPRSPTWYLGSRTGPRPDPLFYGEAGRSWVRVARFEGATHRGYIAWLIAAPWVSDDGGTELRGWITQRPLEEDMMWFRAAIACLVILFLPVAAIVQLALGHLAAGLGVMLLCPLPAIGIAGSNTRSRRAIEREAARLIDELNSLLGSTVTFPDE